MKNPENIRLYCIEDNVLIKDNLIFILLITFISTIIYMFLFKINIKEEIIISFEQAIFVIMSAILLVFNESLISYSTISKISTLLNNLKNKDTKNIIFSKIGKKEDEIIANYEEYINMLNERIKKFKKNIEKFRKHSYILYTIFTISGFLAVITSLSIMKKDFIDPSIISTSIVSITHFCHKSNPYIIEFLITFQIFLIPSWIISAHQTEKQKNQILIFFETPSKIVIDFKKYLDEIENKDIDESITIPPI